MVEMESSNVLNCIPARAMISNHGFNITYSLLGQLGDDPSPSSRLLSQGQWARELRLLQALPGWAITTAWLAEHDKISFDRPQGRLN